MIENKIVARNTEGVSANASAFTTADGMRLNNASPHLKLPDRSQRDAPQDLDIVSWPARKRIPIFGKMPAYVYDIARGIDTYIYIIDNGINMDNAVSIQSPLPALSSPKTTLGVQIHAVAARPQRVALCLRGISEYDRRQPSGAWILRCVQSRWLEDWCFKEFPPGRNEVLTDRSRHQLCFRSGFG